MKMTTEWGFKKKEMKQKSHEDEKLKWETNKIIKKGNKRVKKEFPEGAAASERKPNE